jgi:5-methylcytosine-specific restriction endonuclease McrA
MSDALVILAQQAQREAARKRHDDKTKNPREAKALRTLRSEAKTTGVKLQHAGEGGLPSSLVLGVFRRDHWQCKVCGSNGQNTGGLTVHHKAGIVLSKWLDLKGHSNDPRNIVVVCADCHDAVHTKARELGVDSSQVKPLGDMSAEERAKALQQPNKQTPWRKAMALK